MDFKIICKGFSAENKEENTVAFLEGVDPYDVLDELFEYFNTDLDENDIIIDIFKKKDLENKDE